MQTVEVNYDKENDVLYISIKSGIPSYVEEDVPGILIRKSLDSNILTGITILDFRKRLYDSSIFSINLPVDIDFKSINDSLIH